jgi:hypothetical protein
MKSNTLEALEKYKSTVRCKSFCLLNINKIEEMIGVANESNSPFYHGIKEDKIIEINICTNIFNELNSLNPNIEIILPFFEEKKEVFKKLVKEFESKIELLKLDSTIPKITESYDAGVKVIYTDYTDLNESKILLFEFSNQLNFINDCIAELKTNK